MESKSIGVEGAYSINSKQEKSVQSFLQAKNQDALQPVAHNQEQAEHEEWVKQQQEEQQSQITIQFITPSGNEYCQPLGTDSTLHVANLFTFLQPDDTSLVVYGLMVQNGETQTGITNANEDITKTLHEAGIEHGSVVTVLTRKRDGKLAWEFLYEELQNPSLSLEEYSAMAQGLLKGQPAKAFFKGMRQSIGSQTTVRKLQFRFSEKAEQQLRNYNFDSVDATISSFVLWDQNNRLIMQIELSDNTSFAIEMDGAGQEVLDFEGGW